METFVDHFSLLQMSVKTLESQVRQLQKEMVEMKQILLRTNTQFGLKNMMMTRLTASKKILSSSITRTRRNIKKCSTPLPEEDHSNNDAKIIINDATTSDPTSMDVVRGDQVVTPSVAGEVDQVFDLSKKHYQEAEGNNDPSSSSPKARKTKPLRRGRPKKEPNGQTHPINNDKETPPPLRVYICDECGKVLKSPSSLRSHKLSHSNNRPFACHHCPSAFRMKHHLHFHLLTHDPESGKKWTCRFCERGFIAQRDLLRHERTHTGEKPFPCPYKESCSKSFNVKQHLILHIRTHTGERPYTCGTCGKSFTQANSLRIHRKIHVNSTEDEVQKSSSKKEPKAIP